MSDRFRLSDTQMRRIEPYFPLAWSSPGDDRRVISGIIFVIRYGLRWRDAPGEYGPHKTIYNRFVRWSQMGISNRIFAALAAKGGRPDRLMIDATHLKAHRTAASLLKGAYSQTYRRHQGQPEVQAARGVRRPRSTAGRAAHRGPDERLQGHRPDARRPDARALPKAKALMGDRGYDADWFRAALTERGIISCIPPRANRKVQVDYDKALYRQRHKIENMVARLKDWRCVHTRYVDTPEPSCPPSPSPSPPPSSSGCDQ